MERWEEQHQLPGGAPLGRVIHDQQRPFLRKHRVQVRLLQILREQRAADRLRRHFLDAGTNLAALAEIGTVLHHCFHHLQGLLRRADHHSRLADAASEVSGPGAVPVVQIPEREDKPLLVLIESDRAYACGALHAARAALRNDVHRII